MERALWYLRGNRLRRRMGYIRWKILIRLRLRYVLMRLRIRRA